MNHKKSLFVYYGWAKLNKVAKRDSLVVIFLNDNPGPRIGLDGFDGVSRFMHIAYSRRQSPQELQDAAYSNRLYTSFNIFLDSSSVHGSLNKALDLNYQQDSNNVSRLERDNIRKALRKKYLELYPGYIEPCGYQLDLF